MLMIIDGEMFSTKNNISFIYTYNKIYICIKTRE